MKSALANIGLFFKRPSALYRIGGIIVALIVITQMAIPDILFNIQSGKPIEMTLEQITTSTKEKLPRYIKIKDAVVPSGMYVEVRKNTDLEHIYYPVYPKKSVEVDIKDLKTIKDTTSMDLVADSTGKLSILKDTKIMYARLVIKDGQVNARDLGDKGTYFSNPSFSIEGRYDNSAIGADVMDIFRNGGLNVAPDAILLEKGAASFTTSTALLMILVGFFVILACSLSFVPTATLYAWKGQTLQEEE